MEYEFKRKASSSLMKRHKKRKMSEGGLGLLGLHGERVVLGLLGKRDIN